MGDNFFLKIKKFSTPRSANLRSSVRVGGADLDFFADLNNKIFVQNFTNICFKGTFMKRSSIQIQLYTVH